MKYFYLFLGALCTMQSHAKTNYEDALLNVCHELSNKIEARGIEHVAVLNFEALEETSEAIGKQLTEDFSFTFLNSTSTLKLYEREQLNQILDELRLQKSGLIKESTAQQLGEFTGVEAIITAQYTIHNHHIKLWLKVLETNSAYQIAANKAEIPFSKENFKVAPTKQNNATGSIQLKNKKRSGVYVIVKNEHFEKRVKIASKSKSVLLNVPPGTYTCTIGHQISKETFMSFEIKVESNRTAKEAIKRSRHMPWWFGLGLL